MMSPYLNEIHEQRSESEQKKDLQLEFWKKYVDLFSICLANHTGIKLDEDFQNRLDNKNEEISQEELLILREAVATYNNKLCARRLRGDLNAMLKNKDK